MALRQVPKEVTAFRNSKSDEQPYTINGDFRNRLVQRRMEQLNDLSDQELVGKIVQYFEQNATMPGEKALKDLAERYNCIYNDGSQDNFCPMDEFHDDMIKMFANVSVKEAKVSMFISIPEVSEDECMNILKNDDIFSVSITTNNGTEMNFAKYNNVYSIPVTIRDGDMVALTANGTDAVVGRVADGFLKNHRDMEDTEGTLVMIDNSNGKLKNMTCRMFIDLSQNFEQDDFTKAIEGISTTDEQLAQD